MFKTTQNHVFFYYRTCFRIMLPFIFVTNTNNNNMQAIITLKRLKLISGLAALAALVFLSESSKAFTRVPKIYHRKILSYRLLAL